MKKPKIIFINKENKRRKLFNKEWTNHNKKEAHKTKKCIDCFKKEIFKNKNNQNNKKIHKNYACIECGKVINNNKMYCKEFENNI